MQPAAPASSRPVSRPHVLLSVAMSIDGYLDDASDVRLLLSNALDFERVDEVRAGVDAILVGAQTVRADGPRLLVSADRRARRVAAGLAEHPIKVTLTRTGTVDRAMRFWHSGGQKIVYTVPGPPFDRVSAELRGLADVVVAGASDVDLGVLLDDLGRRGVARLLVEGGGRVHTAFLAQGLADELHLAVAPLLVGDPAAPRFLHAAQFAAGRLQLLEARPVGDVVLLRYAPFRPAPS